MDRALRVLCIDYGIAPVTASKMLSTASARHIKAENIGKIQEAFNADLVLSDSGFEVKTVIKNGIIMNA